MVLQSSTPRREILIDRRETVSRGWFNYFLRKVFFEKHQLESRILSLFCGFLLFVSMLDTAKRSDFSLTIYEFSSRS